VSLHGDGLPSHDEAEALALERALGSRAARTPRLRMKTLHADLGAATSAVELLACSMALEHATLPPGASSIAPSSSASFSDALVISLGLFGECAALMLRTSRNGHAD
jgi:3-oxoacyl-(acyl-carrier-protein) synthase